MAVGCTELRACAGIGRARAIAAMLYTAETPPAVVGRDDFGTLLALSESFRENTKVVHTLGMMAELASGWSACTNGQHVVELAKSKSGAPSALALFRTAPAFDLFGAHICLPDDTDPDVEPSPALCNQVLCEVVSIIGQQRLRTHRRPCWPRFCFATDKSQHGCRPR